MNEGKAMDAALDTILQLTKERDEALAMVRVLMDNNEESA